MVNIEDIPMFSNLDKLFHQELKNSIHIKRFSKNSIVFYEGDESNYLYILLDGSVKLYKTSPKGNQIQIKRMNAPHSRGRICLF